MSHVNTYQRVASGEEDFNNQLDRMTCSVDISRPLSSATPAITHGAHEQSGHGSMDGGCVWAQQNKFPLTMANLPSLH